MSKTLRFVGAMASVVIACDAPHASEVAGGIVPQVVPAAMQSTAESAPASPVAWTSRPAQDRSASPYWRSWRSTEPANQRYRAYVQWPSLAEEAARKAYWRGWYDRQRSAAGYADTVWSARRPYPDSREGFTRYQPRRSVQAGSFAYRNW